MLYVVLVTACAVVAATAIGILYRAALEAERRQLTLTARSQAELIAAVARFDQMHVPLEYPGGAFEATLSQIVQAYSKFRPSDAGEELGVGRMRGEDVEFLFRFDETGAQFDGLVVRDPGLAEPMRAALAGRSGTMIGRDYRGVKVLAAFEPIPELNVGIVAKVPLSEVHGPLVRAASAAGALAVVLAMASLLAVKRLAYPIISRLEASARQLATESEKRQAALDGLERNRRQLELSLKAGAIGSWHWDLTTDVMTCDARTLGFLGLPPDATADRRDLEAFVHPEDMARLAVAREESIRTGRAFECEVRVQRTDGEDAILSVHGERRLDNEGRAVALDGVAMDVTRQKADRRLLEESEARFRSIFEQAAVGIANVSPEGRFLRVNERFCKMLGYKPEELAERTFLEVTHAEDQERDAAEFARLVAGEIASYSIEKRHLRKDGSALWVDRTASFVRAADGTPLYSVSIIQDISARHRAEEEVRRLNEELEERVRVRTAQLEAANKELEAFSYSVSHDLRAPLRAVDGFSRILMEDCEEALSSEDMRHLQAIRAAAQRMGMLIDDLLALSRLGRKALDPVEFDVRAMIEQVRAELERETADRAIEFRIGELPPMRADRVTMRQVLTNLIANAVKYTRGRQPAIIEIGARHEDAVTVYFIRDNGAGFDMRYADKLFGVFQRLHRADEFEGTGVGLAIVHRIVVRHGGRIWAESEPDKGATFHFTIGDCDA
ncbi:MAG: PAS domain S-box protein [Candidatus Sumerlaeia bacterium]|nr:PAS domain S-box protein [Candidatus Sumerlaeia bacterium]